MSIIHPLLNVRDVTTSLAFYTEYLGFVQTDTVLPGKDGKPVFAGVKYGPTILWLDSTEYHELPQNTPLGVGVELYVSLTDETDIEALYTRLKNAGVNIVRELREEFWGQKRFVIADPDGYRLSLVKDVRVVSGDEMAEHTRHS